MELFSCKSSAFGKNVSANTPVVTLKTATAMLAETVETSQNSTLLIFESLSFTMNFSSENILSWFHVLSSSTRRRNLSFSVRTSHGGIDADAVLQDCDAMYISRCIQTFQRSIQPPSPKLPNETNFVGNRSVQFLVTTVVKHSFHVILCVTSNLREHFQLNYTFQFYKNRFHETNFLCACNT
jgi:hypothetical protein